MSRKYDCSWIEQSRRIENWLVRLRPHKSSKFWKLENRLRTPQESRDFTGKYTVSSGELNFTNLGVEWVSFGKIIKSIFSKLWKRELQFFSDFQNFFGFLKFREEYIFFVCIIQFSCTHVKWRCRLLVIVIRCGAGGHWFETDHTLPKHT